MKPNNGKTHKKLNLDPHHPLVIARVHERIRSMTREELEAFLHYRTPGIEETDMTGMFADLPEIKNAANKKKELPIP